ncbi:hypothetical protein PspLS_11129, partial [Pyricularia sp. CBS 133598]
AVTRRRRSLKFRPNGPDSEAGCRAGSSRVRPVSETTKAISTVALQLKGAWMVFQVQWSPVPFHLFRMLTYMTDDATMLTHRPVRESLHAMPGWASNVASYQ